MINNLSSSPHGRFVQDFPKEPLIKSLVAETGF
jgi:hypothetical protein